MFDGDNLVVFGSGGNVLERPSCRSNTLASQGNRITPRYPKTR